MFKMVKNIISIALIVASCLLIGYGFYSLKKLNNASDKFEMDMAVLPMDLGKELYKNKLVKEKSFKKADSAYKIDQKKILNEIYK